MAGNVGALLHAHCEWFLVSLQDSHFIVISKSFFFCLSSMSVFQMLEEGGLLPDLGCLAAELWHMLLDATMSILSRLAKVAGSAIVDIMFSWTSSPQAEEAGHPVADCVPSAVDLVLGIFAGNAFGVTALVSSKKDQCCP